MIRLTTAMLFMVAGSQAVLGDDSHYYPQVSGAPAGVIVGRLLDFGFGMGSGGMTIRTASGKTVDLYTAKPPFSINGKQVDCPMPPKNGAKPDREVCPVWPTQVIVGESEVRVPYWRGTRYGKPTLITNAFRTVRKL